MTTGCASSRDRHQRLTSAASLARHSKATDAKDQVRKRNKARELWCVSSEVSEREFRWSNQVGGEEKESVCERKKRGAA